MSWLVCLQEIRWKKHGKSILLVAADASSGAHRCRTCDNSFDRSRRNAFGLILIYHPTRRIGQDKTKRRIKTNQDESDRSRRIRRTQTCPGGHFARQIHGNAHSFARNYQELALSSPAPQLVHRSFQRAARKSRRRRPPAAFPFPIETTRNRRRTDRSPPSASRGCRPLACRSSGRLPYAGSRECGPARAPTPSASRSGSSRPDCRAW